MLFHHTHTSGRFNVAADIFKKYLLEYMSSSDLVTVTEVDNNARARMLQEPGWGCVFGNKSPRDDCGIAWRTAKFKKIWADTVALSNYRYKNERGWETGVTYGAFAVLELSNGKRLVVGVAHTPHGMQEELKTNRVHTDVGRAYVAITHAFLRKAQRYAKQHNADGILLCADWNLNLRFGWVRAWFATYTRGTGFKVNWNSGHLPAGGTHGKEVIDAALYKVLMLLGRPALRKHDPSSDHTAWSEEFAL